MAGKNTSSQAASIYKSRRTILEFMKYQGYETEEYDNFSINEVSARLATSQLDMLVEKDDQKTYIRYVLDQSLKKKNIKDMIEDLFETEEVLNKRTDTLVVISNEEMNEPIMIELKHIWEQEGILVIIFSMRRLQYNILQHELVPPHRILSQDEVEETKTKFNITSMTQFPDISRFDPVSQAIGIRPGQLCQITRNSKTAIQSTYYRVCV